MSEERKRVDAILQKEKYFEKVLSADGFTATFMRYLDYAPIFARELWSDIPLFDLTNLGIGLMYNLTPVELEPLSVFYLPTWPTDLELNLGIQIKFELFDFSIEFPEFLFPFDFLLSLFDLQFLFDLLNSLLLKAYFGTGKYGFSVYDPSPFREYVRGTLYKNRQMKYLDITFQSMSTILEEVTGVHEQTDYILNSRIDFLRSAQRELFVIGLSLLGKGKLCRGDGEYAVFQTLDANGNPVEVKVKFLEELMFGLWLGIIPLGFGCLMPRRTVFRFDDPKKMPKFFYYLDKKIRAFIHQYIMTPFAWRNYTMSEETLSPHRSERTMQYHSLQTMRSMVESFVEKILPPSEKDAVRLRQYQNAVLQLISYPTKRHKWGFGAYKAMTEEEFLEFWFSYWEAQGLNRDVLNNLYEGIKPCLSQLREEKLRQGMKLKTERTNLAKSGVKL